MGHLSSLPILSKWDVSDIFVDRICLKKREKEKRFRGLCLEIEISDVENQSKRRTGGGEKREKIVEEVGGKCLVFEIFEPRQTFSFSGKSRKHEYTTRTAFGLAYTVF